MGEKDFFFWSMAWGTRTCAGPAEPVVEIISGIKEVKKLQGEVVIQEQGNGGRSSSV